MAAIEADYLVIGAGAMGMAFADTIIAETAANLVIVDRYHQPGGHWTTAYPFVRLHQPSACYGVNSRKLGGDTIDRVGWNEGLYELATSGEVCSYFDQVMQQPRGMQRDLRVAFGAGDQINETSNWRRARAGRGCFGGADTCAKSPSTG